jgi:hypothetical protein
MDEPETICRCGHTLDRHGLGGSHCLHMHCHEYPAGRILKLCDCTAFRHQEKANESDDK